MYNIINIITIDYKLTASINALDSLLIRNLWDRSAIYGHKKNKKTGKISTFRKNRAREVSSQKPLTNEIFSKNFLFSLCFLKQWLASFITIWLYKSTNTNKDIKSTKFLRKPVAPTPLNYYISTKANKYAKLCICGTTTMFFNYRSSINHHKKSLTMKTKTNTGKIQKFCKKKVREESAGTI